MVQQLFIKYFGNNDGLKMYLNNIRKYKAPTDEEEKELFIRYKNGDMSARDELVVRNQRFVYKIAKVYAKDEEEVIDYVNEGNIGLMEAIDKFDVSRGFKFVTFCVNYIQRNMGYYMLVTNNLVRKSNNAKYAKKIEAFKQKFINENGYEPNEDDIIYGLKEEYNIDILDKRDVTDMDVSSISETMDSDDEYEDASEFSITTANELEYEEKVNEEYNHAFCDSILNTLPLQQQEIVRLVFGIGVERPLEMSELAEKYGLTTVNMTKKVNSIISYLKQNKSNYSMVV